MLPHLQLLLLAVPLLCLVGVAVRRSPASWTIFPALSGLLFLVFALLGSSLTIVVASIALTVALWLCQSALRRHPLLALVPTFGVLFGLDLFASASPGLRSSTESAYGPLRPHVIIGFSYMIFRLHDALVAGPAPIRASRVLLQLLPFPAQTAGPILMRGNYRVRPQPFSFRRPFYNHAVLLIAWGLTKVLVLLPAIQYHFETGLLLPLRPGWAAIGNVLHTAFYHYARLYLDFSAYTDIAVGLCALLGLRVRHNFRRPFLATTLAEFWRRWHITLSFWVRRHVYIPMGGSRGSTGRTAVNLLLCMTLVGLWHGLRGNFLLWGVLHGSWLVGERFVVLPLLRHLGCERHFAVRILLWLCTQVFVALSWIAFFWR